MMVPFRRLLFCSLVWIITPIESFSPVTTSLHRRLQHNNLCRTILHSSFTTAASNDVTSDEAAVDTNTPPSMNQSVAFVPGLQGEVKVSPKQRLTEILKGKHPKYDLPWGDVQQWALADSLPRYTMQVVVGSNLQVFTLWRTISNEVVELSGYPLPFLVERQMELQQHYAGQQPADASRSSPFHTSPTILPFLDQYEFTANGGLAGTVYGVQGIADGTRIETTPVENVDLTLHKGFVRTQESVFYELGRPREIAASSSQPGVQGADWVLRSSLEARQSASNLLGAASNAPPPIVDGELVQLGVLTAMTIAGAVAFQSLSHHLTVNVFWV